jgi:hypothetical protein
MLLADTTSTQSESQTKETARRTIATKYLGTQPLERYQVLLRQAQQAHAQGKFDIERARYRAVLDMLHAEGQNKYEGLTGVAVPGPDSADVPNDQELKKTHSTLLAD